MASTSSSSVLEERRIWVGNLDPRLSEFQLLKIVQKCGAIEKFDMLFHKGGPLQGQSRGYAFVTFAQAEGAIRALDKLNGHMVLNRPIAVRLAKNVNYDELERPKPKIEIPALGTGKKEGKISKEEAIKAIEQKLKLLESQKDDLEFNQSLACEVPLIQKYQFNKDRDSSGACTTSQRRTYHKSSSGPYNRHQRPKRR
ncbi:probable RNA-binding protein 18 [Lucilia sericata]|uniref:probable RNA-binding protein 18 n=1 Tax=Lucilia sericata TaxID=13632 RepID=UPI0018A832D5|nr:probable RNA-binding protein 18 [Lucilia sericata]XP_037827718.1 probable RNA-binding protein 18 [Lucilia sericata]